MIKFDLDLRRLRTFISDFQELSDKNSYIQQFSKIYLNITGKTVTFYITGSYGQASAEYQLESEAQKDISMLLDMEALKQITSTLNEVVSVTVEDKNVKIKLGKKSFSLYGEDPGNFLLYPTITGTEIALTKDLLKMVRRASKFLRENKSDLRQSSILFEFSGDSVGITSTDGNCLFFGRLPIQCGNFSALLNEQGLKYLLKSGESKRLTFSETSIQLQVSEFKAVIQNTNMEYYPVSQLKSLPDFLKLSIKKSDLMDLCSTHSVIALDGLGEVQISDGVLTLCSVKSGVGEAVCGFEVDYCGEPMKMSVDLSKIGAFLSGEDEEEVKLSLHNNKNGYRFLTLKSRDDSELVISYT